MRSIKNGNAMQVDHAQAELIARAVMRRDGGLDFAKGFNLSADNERIILAAAYLDLLQETLPLDMEIVVS